MKYRPGRQNLDADALSRQNWTNYTTEGRAFNSPEGNLGPYPTSGPIVSLSALEEGNRGGAVMNELSDWRE